MTQKNQKAQGFIRKNLYYFVFILCLGVLTFITVAFVISANNSSKSVVGDNVIDNEEKPNENEEEQKPVVSVIIFDMPILNASIIKDFVSDGVIYNQTLGLYSGHKGIDFSAEEGTQVLACYDGVIESITTSKLEGATSVMTHLYIFAARVVLTTKERVSVL